MRTYIAKRLLLIVPTLLGAATLVFVIMRVIPGDVALLILGGDQGQIDQKQLDAMRQQLGLDQPLVVQFGTWLWGVLRFDFGNSPRDFLEPKAETLILTTTNGTRAIVEAAADCDVVFVGSLLNLEAVAAAARERGEDMEVVCAGVDGRFALDDAYCAGRIAELLGGERTDGAEAAVRIARSFPAAEDAFRASVNPHDRSIEADLAWCARENAASVVPRFVAMRGPAAEIVRA